MLDLSIGCHDRSAARKPRGGAGGAPAYAARVSYRRDLDALSFDPKLRELEREEAARILADVRRRAEADEAARAMALPARLLAAAVGGPLVAVGLGLAEVGQYGAALGCALVAGAVVWGLEKLR